MKDIEVVPRFRINGKYYTLDELPEDLREQARQFAIDKIDMAMKALNYERQKTA